MALVDKQRPTRSLEKISLRYGSILPVPPSPMRIKRVEIVLDQATDFMDFPLDLGNPAPLLVHLLHNLVVELIDIINSVSGTCLPLARLSTYFSNSRM
jgi:hypothetical protein